MDAVHVLEQQTTGQGGEQRPNENNIDQTANPNINTSFPLPNLKHYKWWLKITIYIVLVLVGQAAATLLGRLYFDKGGNSKWMSTLVQSAGFPIVIPLLFFHKPTSSPTSPSILNLCLLYLVFGLLLAGDNLMYSYGLLYLPVSTYSLLCATQLAFNAVSSFFINSQKITALVMNSLVLLTISASLLAINANNEPNASNNVESNGKFTIGFLCTIAASLVYALFLSLVQLAFVKLIKDESYSNVVPMLVYPSFVSTCSCVVGLFASGEWITIKKEMKDYEMGSVSYVMTLVWIAISWQFFSVGLVGLIWEVSALFSNVICTVGLPLVPIFAVVFFHDKMNGVKIIALVLAMWGFLSYIYQHYLDTTREARKVLEVNSRNDEDVTIEICNK